MRPQHAVSKFRLILWFIFLGGNLLLILGDSFLHIPVALSAFILFFLLIVGLVLFIVYRHVVAQWRAVLFFVFLYIIFRWLSIFAHHQTWTVLEATSMAIVLYAMFAMWGSLLALAIARDVSVAYLVIFAIFAPLVMKMALAQAGGILGILQSNASNESSYTFSLLESIIAGLSCLIPLAFFTFLPHFLWLWYKEWNRSPL